MAGELLLYIDEILVHGIQTAGKQAAEVDAHTRVLLEKLGGVHDEMELAGNRSANRSGVRHRHQGGEVTEDGARLIHFCHDDSVFDHFDGTFDEEVDVAGVVALIEDKISLREMIDRIFAQCGKKKVHHGVNKRQGRVTGKPFVPAIEMHRDR